ncbi:hypothetical protein Fmac_022368 [Flemingia macrophylla]|uniref:BURP domain-containing protein n=1 Tax=Flemingia macrophylla TaxID=520843 RepID=A0ABD1LZL6_9FABA
MAPTHILPLFLFLLMSGHIGARDLKSEFGDDKQGKWYKATSMSNDESYAQGFMLSPESAEPNYIASYHAKKHNHHYANRHQPYITYESNTPYIAGYRTSSHVTKNQHYDPDYETKTHNSNEPYIAGYRTTTAFVTKNQPNYDAVYKAKTHDSDVPYIAGYATTSAPVTNNQPNYDAVYGAKTHDSNLPYITATTQYGGVGPLKESSHDTKEASKESSNEDTTRPYITQYGRVGLSKESSKVDHTEAFKTGFFGIDDLYVGNVMTLQFPIQEIPKYLPRKEADSIPFSTSQLPSVLQLFSIPRDSPEAKAMRFTLDQCEAKHLTGETKICVTSLESMLEFVGTIIGSEVKYNILTTSYPTTSSDSLQKYTILDISEDINVPKWVACHPQPYPYAVYYCHFISTGTKVFKVSLGSENGDNKIEALGVCHLDTSEWSPEHIIFKQLGIKPGKAPVCHFFPITHVMWVPQSSQATM